MRGLFELAYLLGLEVDRRRKSARARRLPEGKVVSVGNLTAGGTGKTPLVIMLAGRFFAEAGLCPAVLTRGYKGTLPGPVLITPGMSASQAGDEPLLIAEKLKNPGVPVIKGKDRYEAGLYALRELKPKPGIFILDDGFQHWGLRRDLDILILGASGEDFCPFYQDKLLPVGNLREPPAGIGRADIIVASGIREVPPDFEAEVRRYNPHAPIFAAWYEAKWVIGAAGGKSKKLKYPPDWLSGREVFAFAGIGRPESFRRSLLDAGAVIKGFLKFPDHHVFTAAEIDRIRKTAQKNGLEWIITTEKDIMRLKGDGDKEEKGIYALSVEMQASPGFFAGILKRIGSEKCSNT